MGIFAEISILETHKNFFQNDDHRSNNYCQSRKLAEQ